MQVLVQMRTIVHFTGGLDGQGQCPRARADVRAVTVTTINTSDTTYGKITAMGSQARVEQGSTTTGTGVSLIYRHFDSF